MPTTKLAHYSIRTTDLAKSRQFYTRILGFREGFRPPFDFPGVWLYNGDDESEFGVVHIIGVDPSDHSGLHKYLGDKALPASGTGTVDHIAFLATGLIEFHAKLRAAGFEWRDRTVPSLGLHQVFVEDPSGVTIELNFPAHEAAALEQTSPAANDLTPGGI
ncbi:catechol 2,3-dioxygenase-like lactoylglutathione lyase family enzyme [Trinickia symbiotica]|uniref:Glyoxalase n=1 Tax=Trinickia symbiotica TaxID=863227 RepID=A0A2N7X9J0_9BURK|nr:VOC family protein [Trinickia symbiotica]PMS38426.1 glyoxalase [Trinickia symbiotica]PPK46438.1 catechol 2,3-dioxygenase-like lactoylglutathione lyase family enzyme [Trinickia symbiotica]